MQGVEVAVSKRASSHFCRFPIKAEADFNQATPELLDGDLALESAVDLTSAQNSQTFSSGESLASQGSQPQRTSQDTSQSSLEQAQQLPSFVASTHVHSSEGSPSAPASQVSLLGPPLTARDSNTRLQPALPTLDVHGVFLGGYHADNVHGQKRTASGHVKSSSSSLATSPVEALGKGHSRSTSTSTQIGEVSTHETGIPYPFLTNVQLSAELKTRLSYAMVKVQNGWQSRTIDEVESLASTQGCITSPIQPFKSPRKKDYQGMAGIQDPSERTTTSSALLLSPSNTKQPTRNQNYAYASSHMNASSSPPKHHRGHFSPQDVGLGSEYAYMPPSAQQGPSLAPPVDFAPCSNARRSHQYPHASALHHNGVRSLSNLSASSTSSRSTVPATPPQKRLSPIKTPNATSKATAMEKDAIETLLFMSSPGNSQRHPTNSQLSGTPLRSTFSTTEKHVGFVDDDLPLSLRKRDLLESVNLATDDNIDKVLEQMADAGSSSDDEI